MKFGYWSPVWGSWLRNVDDDPTPCSWEYVRDLAVSLETKVMNSPLCQNLT